MRNHYIMLGMGLLLGAMLALSLAVEAYAAPPPNDVLAAAEKGLPAFLKAIPKSELERYGFNNQQELSEAILGEPHEVFTITPEAIKSYQGGARLPDLLSKTNLWFFPVIVAGEPRTILTVALMQGKWEAVDIGGLVLPKNLERVGKGLPDMMGTGVKTAYTTRFVRVFQLYADFVAVESAEGDYLVPIMMRPKAMGVENMKLYSLEEVFPRLSAALDKIVDKSF